MICRPPFRLTEIHDPGWSAVNRLPAAAPPHTQQEVHVGTSARHTGPGSNSSFHEAGGIDHRVPER